MESPSELAILKLGIKRAFEFTLKHGPVNSLQPSCFQIFSWIYRGGVIPKTGLRKQSTAPLIYTRKIWFVSSHFSCWRRHCGLPGRWRFRLPRAVPQDLLFPAGSSSKTIAAELERAGVVRSRFAFELLHYAMPGKKLKAGEYRFVTAANGFEVFERIARGDVLVHTVVVPEGYNMFEIAAAIEAAGLGKKEDFLAVATHDTALIHAVDPQAKSLEGYLFPDTYLVLPHHDHAGHGGGDGAALPERGARPGPAAGHAPAGDPRLNCGEGDRRPGRAARGRQRVCQPAGEEHGSGRRSHAWCMPPCSREIIAAPSTKAICNRTRLTTLTSLRDCHRGRLPIPATASLKAAMQPANTGYLFFVAVGDGSGRHHFSANFEQHERNVIAYRKAVKAR